MNLFILERAKKQCSLFVGLYSTFFLLFLFILPVLLSCSEGRRGSFTPTKFINREDKKNDPTKKKPISLKTYKIKCPTPSDSFTLVHPSTQGGSPQTGIQIYQCINDLNLIDTVWKETPIDVEEFKDVDQTLYSSGGYIALKKKRAQYLKENASSEVQSKIYTLAEKVSHADLELATQNKDKTKIRIFFNGIKDPIEFIENKDIESNEKKDEILIFSPLDREVDQKRETSENAIVPKAISARLECLEKKKTTNSTIPICSVYLAKFSFETIPLEILFFRNQIGSISYDFSPDTTGLQESKKSPLQKLLTKKDSINQVYLTASSVIFGRTKADIQFLINSKTVLSFQGPLLDVQKYQLKSGSKNGEIPQFSWNWTIISLDSQQKLNDSELLLKKTIKKIQLIKNYSFFSGQDYLSVLLTESLGEEADSMEITTLLNARKQL